MLQPKEPLDDEIIRRAERQRRKDAMRVANESHQIGGIEDESINDERRYKLGLENIDRSMGGVMRPGGLMVLAAITGYGKTSLLEQCARVNAEKHKVFLATLEMEETEIQANMTAREMGVALAEYERLRRLNAQSYRDATEKMLALRLRLYRPQFGGPGNIRTIFKQAELAESEILAIDYASLLEGWTPGNEANKMVDWIAREAKATGLYVILLAQLSFDNIGKRPTVRDIGESGRLARASTTTIILHRPFAGQKKRDQIAEIIVCKNRKGPLFRGHVHWMDEMRSFYSMTPIEEASCECCKPRPKKDKAPAPQRVKTESRAEEDAILEDSFPFSAP